MFDQLLSLITYEKLILFFKEKSFSFHEKNLIRLDERIVKILDSDILKYILPEDITQKMFTNGSLTLLAFVFTLRHKITILNLLFHASSLSKENREIFLKNLDVCLKFKIFDLFYENEHLLSPYFWGDNFLPVVGFSAVGCLFSMQQIGLCRAFDHYDILHCSKMTNNVFCATHENEIFWLNEFKNEASTQAKMFRFYLDKNNFKEFDEESLQKLLNNFFHKYTNYKHSFSQKMQKSSSAQIKLELEFYKFASIEELKQLGLVELRKRFLEKAKLLHPDVGGSQEMFREARNKYELLRELL